MENIPFLEEIQIRYQCHFHWMNSKRISINNYYSNISIKQKNLYNNNDSLDLRRRKKKKHRHTILDNVDDVVDVVDVDEVDGNDLEDVVDEMLNGCGDWFSNDF